MLSSLQENRNGLFLTDKTPHNMKREQNKDISITNTNLSEDKKQQFKTPPLHYLHIQQAFFNKQHFIERLHTSSQNATEYKSA